MPEEGIEVEQGNHHPPQNARSGAYMKYYVGNFFCRTIAFHPEGNCLFSGSQDAFRVRLFLLHSLQF